MCVCDGKNQVFPSNVARPYSGGWAFHQECHMTSKSQFLTKTSKQLCEQFNWLNDYIMPSLSTFHSNCRFWSNPLLLCRLLHHLLINFFSLMIFQFLFLKYIRYKFDIILITGSFYSILNVSFNYNHLR